MLWFAVNNDRITFLSDLLASVPHLFYERTGGIVFFCLDSKAMESFFHIPCSSECGYNYNVFWLQCIKRNQFFPISILKEANTLLTQVSIHLRVMDHFAEQVNIPVGIFFNGA